MTMEHEEELSASLLPSVRRGWDDQQDDESKETKHVDNDEHNSLVGPKSAIDNSSLHTMLSLSSSAAIDQISTTTKLYDREQQQDELLQAYRRRIAPSKEDDVTAAVVAKPCRCCRPRRELVLISGPSGTGKTALALSIKPQVAAHSGFFIAGKFDQLQRPEPYAPFCVAFTDLVRQILDTRRRCDNQDLIQTIRNKLVETVDSISMITDMIPAVSQLLGTDTTLIMDQEEGEGKSGGYGTGTQGRFLLVFCQFVRAICSPDCPLVLFLDDLQWAEPASIELCAALVADAASIPGLMVLGACRGNEVAIGHHLAVTLRELEADGVIITNIQVDNASKEAFQDLLLDMFQLSHDPGSSLANVVHQHTNGNIFFAMEFLESLQTTGLLVRDELKKWSWEPNDDVLSTLHYDSVVDLVSHKIQQLPPYEQEIVKIASCLGSEFDDVLIKKMVDTKEASRALDAAQTNGLIVKQNNSSGFRFRHDRIQQAAFNLIPADQKAAFHLSIGRTLLQVLTLDEIQANIFLIVNMLQVGVELIETQDERIGMATLCLRAAEKASVSSAFLVAFKYLNLGLSLLGNRPWRDHYALTLDLTNAAAEVAYCNADYEGVDALTASVLLEARCFDDKVRAYTIQIYSLGTRHCMQRAIDIGFNVLRELGEPFPKNGRMVYIMMNLVKTNRMLRNKSMDDIINLPMLLDPNKLAAIRIMNLIIPYCMDGRLEYAPLLAMRVVQITMKSGISSMSCVGFASYALMLASAFGDVVNGYRLGQVALGILERFKAKEWMARVYSACYGLCFTWQQPLRNSLKPLLVAHRVGLSTGDIEFSMLSASMYAGVALHAGCNLDKLLGEFTTFFEMMKTYKQYKMLAYIRAQLQLVHNFLGKATNPAFLNGEVLNSIMATDEAVQEHNTTVIALLHLYNLILAFFFNEYDLAREQGLMLSRCNTGAFSSFTFSTQFLMEGMACLARVDQPTYQGKRIVRRHLKKLKKYAQLCPANIANKVYLLEAEIAASNGNMNLAICKYGMAIDQASKESILHEKALACERAGIYLRDQGRLCNSLRFFAQASSAYEEWGCMRKADQMKIEIEKISKIRGQNGRSESASGAFCDAV